MNVAALVELIVNILEKALNWASPFFLGKLLEKKKWEENTNEVVDKLNDERVEIHRDNVVSSDAVTTRDKLRKWTRRGD